jgi:hypothetical protein
MALRRLYNLTTASGGASGGGFLPGGAGVAVQGQNVNPWISGPRIEEYKMEVLDTRAVSSVPVPSASGKLLVLDPTTGTIGGATWTRNSVANRPFPAGTYGIVDTPGQASEASATGNPNQSTGTKALVVTSGPVQALVTTSPTNTTAISAGMYLSSDTGGNLTYAGASPAAGTVLATAMGSMAGGISVPTMMPVYVGGF